MKLFERTGGYWMFWTGAIYLGIGLPVALYYKDIRPELIQLAWLIALAMPFWCPPFGRWLNMSIEWDQKMFNWFKGKNVPSNVVPFPGEKKAEPPPPAEPPKEKPAHTFYRLGITDNQRISFQMGYSEITMNAVGCQQLIDQLEFFKNQLRDEDA
jgi:hypothetical protein